MKEIKILNDYPVILTRDEEFVKNLDGRVFEPGSCVILPEDAVLISVPQNTNMMVDPDVKNLRD